MHAYSWCSADFSLSSIYQIVTTSTTVLVSSWNDHFQQVSYNKKGIVHAWMRHVDWTLHGKALVNPEHRLRTDTAHGTQKRKTWTCVESLTSPQIKATHKTGDEKECNVRGNKHFIVWPTEWRDGKSEKCHLSKGGYVNGLLLHTNTSCGRETRSIWLHEHAFYRSLA